MKKNIIKLAALLGMIGILAGCGSNEKEETKEIVVTEEAAEKNEEAAEVKAEGTITVYTSVPQDMIDAFQNEFTDKYPNIKVNVYRATSGEVLTKLNTEKDAGKMTCDVVWVADFSSADSLKDLDLLKIYDSAEAANIEDALKDPEGYYYGSRVINMVLAYNTAIDAPESWNDLLDESLKNKVGIPSVSSGSAFQYIGTMSSNEAFGWDFFNNLKANGGVQFKANKDVLQRIATGEIMAGAVLDYMVTEMKEQGSPVDYVIPTEGAIAVASPIALINGAPNEEAAKVFIEYVLSVEGQELLASLKTTPARRGIEVPEGVLSLDTLTLMDSDSYYISANAAEIKNQFNSIFGE